MIKTSDFEIKCLGVYYNDEPVHYNKGSYENVVVGNGLTEDDAILSAKFQLEAYGYELDPVIFSYHEIRGWECGPNQLVYVTICWNNDRLRRVLEYGLDLYEYHDYHFNGELWCYRHEIPSGIKVLDSDLKIRVDSNKSAYLRIQYDYEFLESFGRLHYVWVTTNANIIIGLNDLLNSPQFEEILEVIGEVVEEVK